MKEIKKNNTKTGQNDGNVPDELLERWGQQRSQRLLLSFLPDGADWSFVRVCYPLLLLWTIGWTSEFPF